AVAERFEGPHANRVAEPLLANVPHMTLRPNVGDLVLFNTRYPHRVIMERGDGNLGHERIPERIQMGCFMGLTDDQKLLVWS
ncbi:MAG: hypothetical protein ACR2PS_01630, partial [Pseudomonadales bacterium]